MLKPVRDKILLKEIEDKNQENDLGVIVSVSNDETKEKNRLIKCEIIDVSDGFIDENGNERKIDNRLLVGETVIIDKYSGSKITENGQEYILAKQIEVMAIVK